MDSNRQLLFGLIALQADLIEQEQLIEAWTDWCKRKEVPLERIFQDRGWLSETDKTALSGILELKLRKHEGNAQASLAEMMRGQVGQALTTIKDPEIQRLLADLPSVEGHLLVSTIVFQPESRDRYTLTRLHAQGGIGRVWLARDSDFGREVALKELQPDRADSPAVVARFLEEAKITGQLEHPSIVPVYELARRPGECNPFYTMRYVKGRTLTEAVKDFHHKRRRREAGSLELRELLGAFLGVCNALAYAHSRGVIHRDLKGQNVVLGKFGEVIVLDWGLAKVLGEKPSVEPAVLTSLLPVSVKKEDSRDETIAGSVLGTPAYMAPEQAEGRLDRVDHRADIYGLVAILYEILTGQPPFVGTDTQEVLERVRHAPPQPPAGSCPKRRRHWKRFA